jgi:hypothetical protein
MIGTGRAEQCPVCIRPNNYTCVFAAQLLSALTQGSGLSAGEYVSLGYYEKDVSFDCFMPL